MKNFFPTIAATFIIGNPKKTGVIKLDGFDDVIKESKTNCGDGIIMYENVNFSDGDITLPIVALGDKRLMYSFGKNFGSVAITGTIYNANPEQLKLASLGKLYDKFNSERVSQKLSTIDLSVDSGFKCKLFVTSFSLSGANPQNHSIGFTVEGIVCPPSNKG